MSNTDFYGYAEERKERFMSKTEEKNYFKRKREHQNNVIERLRQRIAEEELKEIETLRKKQNYD